jgi:hypothetical protein
MLSMPALGILIPKDRTLASRYLGLQSAGIENAHEKAGTSATRSCDEEMLAHG